MLVFVIKWHKGIGLRHLPDEGQILSVVFGEESSHFDSCICPQNVELVHCGTLEVTPGHIILVTIIEGENTLVGLEQVLSLI